ncbi:MAG: hypothetical protein JSV71_04130 [Nitrospiraceae bacterium]|nr:MAG: hypothetical protein JSV71_04130 [Nitrospiraceae bacterium]
MAHVLNLRCRYIRGEKAKAIKRFIGIERFTLRMLPLVVVNGLLKKRKITLGVDSLLFKSAIIMKMANRLYRFNRSFTG